MIDGIDASDCVEGVRKRELLRRVHNLEFGESG
jgi:hypothetical protein